MTFEQLEQIKSAIEAFPKAKFVSLLEGNKICVQNTETDQIFEVEYEEMEGCGYKFKGSKALSKKKKKAKNPKAQKIEEFKENCETLRSSLQGIFAEENFEEAVEKLKATIRDLPVVDAASIEQEIAIIQEENEDKQYSEFIRNNFSAQLEAYYKEEKEFKDSLNLFDADDEINTNEILDRGQISESLKAADEVYNKFKSDAKIFENVKIQIAKTLGGQDEAEKFLESIDFTKNIKVGVTKNLLAVKQMNENIDIRKAAVELVSIFENNMLPIGGAPMPAIYNLAQDNKYTPKFLRFKMGVFSVNDVRTMINEVNETFSRLGDYTEEDMMFLSDVKMKLEYMFNSQQLNDHLLVEIIEEFNKRFAADRAADYDDAGKQLAWKNRDQQKVGNAQGIEVSSAPEV